MGYFNLRPWKKAPELPAKTVEPEVPPTSILLRRAEEYQQMVADVLEAGASEDELPIAEPVANGVVEMWSIDRGYHFEHLSQRHLDQAGLSFEAVRHSALEQLREAAKGLRIEGGDGRFRVSYPDNPICARPSSWSPMSGWIRLHYSGRPFMLWERVRSSMCVAPRTQLQSAE